jgi:hypothetical protein
MRVELSELSSTVSFLGCNVDGSAALVGTEPSKAVHRSTAITGGGVSTRLACLHVGFLSPHLHCE